MKHPNHPRKFEPIRGFIYLHFFSLCEALRPSLVGCVLTHHFVELSGPRNTRNYTENVLKYFPSV
jgi:hypothetical protein